VRDKLAKKILKHLGLNVSLLPCSSIFAKDYYNIPKKEPTIIALNYMHQGGHYKFGQKIKSKKWKKTFKEFYNSIKDKYSCVLVCHNRDELLEAKKNFPGAKIFFSKKDRDYLRFYSKVKFGIVNRIHAAFAIASFGRPSFVIGADSRAKMVEEIDLEHCFVSDVNCEILLKQFEKLDANYRNYENVFLSIKRKAFDGYMNSLKL
jgi:hypothetical protein